MAANTCEVEVWVIVDENGDAAAGTSEDQAAERYAEDVGGDQGSIGLRRVKVTLSVPLPAVIELAGELAEDDEQPVLRVA